MDASNISVSIQINDDDKKFDYNVDKSQGDSSYLSQMSQTLRTAQKEINEYLTEIVEKEKANKNGTSKNIVEENDEESDDNELEEPNQKKSRSD